VKNWRRLSDPDKKSFSPTICIFPGFITLDIAMNLRETILEEHSKANCTSIVKWIGNSQDRFDQLFDLFLHDEYRIVQRAAWPVSNCVIDHPELIKKHFSKLIANLDKPNIHDAVVRNTLRLLQHVSIPKRLHGKIMDLHLLMHRLLSRHFPSPFFKRFQNNILRSLMRSG
jgi:hypothetical protein